MSAAPESAGAAAALRKQAELGMREDAPEDAVRAREQLLQMYRERHARGQRLDIDSRGDSRAWGAADFDGLEWLCRLGAAGHAGAARLVDRVLENRYFSTYAPDEAMSALGRRHPRIARHIAVGIGASKTFDTAELQAWLERAGGAHARIAAALRELQDEPQQRQREFDILREHLGRAERGTPTAWPQELVAQVALFRFDCATPEQRPAAKKLLERAAELGSREARDALWMQRHAAAPDQAAFVREWLAQNPAPQGVGSLQGRTIGLALERGEAGAPADLAAALRWYGAALEVAKPPAPGRRDGIDPRYCYYAGYGFESVWGDKAAARAWYERGIVYGDETCLRRWLDACFGQQLGIRREGAAALEQVRRGIAGGIVPGTPALVDSARAFRHVQGEHWQEFMALLGYTRELRAKEEAAAAEALRQEKLRRARASLEAALELLPLREEDARLRLRQVVRDGDAEQRARAQQLLDGKGWPALPPDDVALCWKLLERVDSLPNAKVENFSQILRYLSALLRDPAVQGDPRLARVAPAIARVRALLDAAVTAAANAPIDDQEAATQLDLAEAYIEMGDLTGARDLLEQVLRQAAGTYKARALKMLDGLG